MKHNKITYKGVVAKLGQNKILIIPKSLHSQLKGTENKRLRVTVILEELNSE